MPTAASLEFRRFASGDPGSEQMPFDGSQCRVAGGSFAPLPPVYDGKGKPFDPAGAESNPAPGFYTGEPVVVAIKDANRNADPAARDYVDVDIATTTGDAETLRLQETGEDTGVFAGAIQSVAIPPAATQYDCALSLAASATINARYTDADFPLDALAVTAAGYAALQSDRVLRLDQSVSKQVVEVGDFLQYTLVLKNIDEAPVYEARIVDTLPPGLRYRAGSLRVAVPASSGGPVIRPASLAAATGGPANPDPSIDGSGRHLEFPVGDLGPGASVTATFVVEVGSGAAGPQLVNRAVARADHALTSNDTDTVVSMRDLLMASRFTIIGDITEGHCDAGGSKPVAGVRLLLEDGTFVVSDHNGAYHFNGVRPGTHVVQLDLATLPPGMELAPCLQNTRFAGRSYSQFVEAQGGALARADFRLQRKAAPAGEVGLQLEAEPQDGKVLFAAALDGGGIAVSNLRAMLALPEGGNFVAGSARLDGQPIPDPEVTGNVAVFALGEPGVGWRRRLEFSVEPGTCQGSGQSVKAFALFNAPGGTGSRTPPVGLVLPCSGPPGKTTSERAFASVTAAAEGSAASSSLRDGLPAAAVSDVEADGGGDVDWFKDQAPGRAWLFPGMEHNPRAPAVRAVVKSLPGDKVDLLLNGQPVSLLNFDGTTFNATRTVAVGIWRGLDLVDGDNLLQARITDRSGQVVATLDRTVHYANSVARAELVPEKSLLGADGIHRPIIAVRMLDRSGHPVRRGVSGDLSISPPYVSAQQVQLQQTRQLAGTDGAKPAWMVADDDGIAYIELAPTGNAGSVLLGFDFGPDAGHRLHQEIKAWLKAAPRDWIVVGFAAGSVGYDTLRDNMQALPGDDDGSGIRGDGKASFYAKGRVLGKWMLTLAYDSGKRTGSLDKPSLLSTIDPNQYYTLYGDGTQQGYDASSARKLYLKLERDQFYALFGDFQTGLDRNQLSRYQRTLNGIKVEYHGPIVEFNGFAAKTSQSYARDEIQGDGTSGLYRLRRHDLVMNSERVRIETRDRYHSEQIIEKRELVRHIDYDIDYDNGTLFFREPIASRDFDFNPNWIVVEYETAGVAEEFTNGGGRAGVHLMGDRLEAGVTYIHDEDAEGRSQLAGVDAKFKLTSHDELRAEAAGSRGEGNEGDDGSSGSAWLLEWEHRGESFNLLAYARRQAGAFGVGQQNASESGMAKAGIQGQYRLDKHFTLQGEAYRLEDLSSGAVREVATLQTEYRADSWGARAGLQMAHDAAEDGTVAESRQVTLGANRTFLQGKLDLGAQADFSVGGKNESVDFPTRLQLGATYEITDAFRVVAAEEFTDGKDRDTATTRLGFEATPWKNAKLTSTLNQSRITEYGPRTFALFGLAQRFLVGQRWGFDVALDSSRAFDQSGNVPLVVDPSQPIQAGGIRDGGALTSDFVALSGGATYRAESWSWNGRVEGRQSDAADRYGITTAFLRQARDGVALSASLQAFSQRGADGSEGLLASAQLSGAFRPTGSRWSMLDKLEFRLASASHGSADGLVVDNTLPVSGDSRSARLINNFVLNYVSDAWSAEDGRGNVLDLDQRSQLSLYYGSKYVLDTYDADDYAGYTDIVGAEWRFDLAPRIDIGLRASVLHSWNLGTFAWAIGPSIGFTPFTNTWVSLGYNIRGFEDRDFEDAHHTAQGPYLVFRMKFDQQSLGLDRDGL